MKHTDVPAQQGWSRRRWLKRTAVGAAAGAAALASGVSLSSQAGRGRSDPGNSGRGGSDQGGGAAPRPNLPPGPPKTFYVIPGCYAGDKPPQATAVAVGCDLAQLRVVPPTEGLR